MTDSIEARLNNHGNNTKNKLPKLYGEVNSVKKHYYKIRLNDGVY